ncbi:hypothetical protein ACFSL4_20030 [Streptomyces caeni]|uniref:Uncharacterized protein n=1 Tax=Streptomyces caeni TaxID=2307231 RepID=A0ABW4IUJ4_9ACTN
MAPAVEYDGPARLRDPLGRLQPSPAAAMAPAKPADPDPPWPVDLLSGQAGRGVADGRPTGVATSWAQRHGGPRSATGRPDAVGAGAAALDRFTRPVAFQDVPRTALPGPLRGTNPWRLPRRVGGLLEGAPR